MWLKNSTQQVLFCTLAMTALFVACPASAQQTTPAASDGEINWLFVVSATGGSFDGKTLTLRDVPPVSQGRGGA